MTYVYLLVSVPKAQYNDNIIVQQYLYWEGEIFIDLRPLRAN